MAKPTIYSGHKKFNLSEPHAGWVQMWANYTRRTFTEQLRIMAEEFRDNHPELPTPNGHEPCNQGN